MGAEEGVCLGMSNEFDEAELFSGAAGERVGFKGELAGFYGDIKGFCFGFCEANSPYFWVCIDDARDGYIFDMGRFVSDKLGDGISFFGGFMGEHGAIYDISDGIDVGMGGAEVVIDGDEPFFVRGDVDVIEAKVLGVGAAADG